MDQTVIVIATRNAGKILEIRDLLKSFPVTLKCLDDFGPIPAIVEDGDSFDENAYLKSSQTARMLGLPALADDSGLVVDALDGQPGVHSARWAGTNATDAERSAKVLTQLADETNRRAAFECVISIAVPTGPALTYESRCEGLITKSPRGSNGFGYDPIFLYPPLGKTFAQMSRTQKSKVSHRGKALRELQSEFEKVLKWIRIHMPQPPNFDCRKSVNA